MDERRRVLKAVKLELENKRVSLERRIDNVSYESAQELKEIIAFAGYYEDVVNLIERDLSSGDLRPPSYYRYNAALLKKHSLKKEPIHDHEEK